MEAWPLALDVRELDGVSILDDASVSVARDLVRSTASAARLPTTASESLATAASELSHNQLLHAKKGRIYARTVERRGVIGVEVIALDAGPGVPEPARAVSGTAPRKKGLGAGLASVARLTDEFDIDVRLGEGTCIRARKFVDAPPFRSEIGVFGRPCSGEEISGDDATYLRRDDDILLAVADGLGHGSLARDASHFLMTLVHEHSSLALEPLLEQCERRLRGTRGAVASLAKLDCKRSLLDHLGLGDITTQIVRRDGTHRMTGQRGFVGSNQPQLGKRRLESVPLGSGDILLAYTDGLKSRIDISREAALLREHPIVIADFILRHFQRQDDDALVLVLR